MLTTYPIWWITLLAGNVVEAILGFVLGFRLINKFFLSKNEAAKEKAARLSEKIVPKQGKLGILGLIVGIKESIIDKLKTINLMD